MSTDPFMLYTGQSDLNRGYVWQVDPDLPMVNGNPDPYGYGAYCTSTIGTNGWYYCYGSMSNQPNITVTAYWCRYPDYINSPANGERGLSQLWNYSNDIPENEACFYTGNGLEYPRVYNDNTDESPYYTDPNTGMTTLLPALNFVDLGMMGYYYNENSILAAYNTDDAGVNHLINYDDITNVKKYISENYSGYLPSQLVFSVPFTLNNIPPTAPSLLLK